MHLVLASKNVREKQVKGIRLNKLARLLLVLCNAALVILFLVNPFTNAVAIPRGNQMERGSGACLQIMDPDVIPLYKAVNECKIGSESSQTDNKTRLDGNDHAFANLFDFGPKFIRMRLTDGVRELQTVIRDK